MALITTTEFKTFRDIGKRIDEDKAQEAIDLVEQGELYDILGDFVFDVVANAADPSYADLMGGSTFTYEGFDYVQKGLKSMIADLAYARYIKSLNVNVTPFGATVKQDENSQPADKASIKELSTQAERDADSKFRIIKKYLDKNRTTFSRFFTGDNPDLGQGRARFSVI